MLVVVLCLLELMLCIPLCTLLRILLCTLLCTLLCFLLSALLAPLLAALLSALLFALKMAPRVSSNCCNFDPQTNQQLIQIALKSILRPLGDLLELSWQAGGLLEASWSALGSLRGRKKDPSSGSRALQEESQDRFQLSWGPKNSQNRARAGPKWSSRGDSS